VWVTWGAREVNPAVPPFEAACTTFRQNDCRPPARVYNRRRLGRTCGTRTKGARGAKRVTPITVIGSSAPPFTMAGQMHRIDPHYAKR
jgi:hypothetical protein